MDLTEIPEFHPRVFNVDLIDEKAFRGVGVSYPCHLSGARHSCVEKDIEIVPLDKIVTFLSQDTFGISRRLSDHAVETTCQKLGESSTKVAISHYYSTPSFRARFHQSGRKG